MTINELTGFSFCQRYHENIDTLALALVEKLSKTAEGCHQIFIDPYVAKAERDAFQKACEQYHYQLITKDCALFGKAKDCAAYIVAYPNCEGNIEDYSDLSESLHEQDIQLIMSCQTAALPLLKSPAVMGADIMYCQDQTSYILASKQSLGEPEQRLEVASDIQQQTAARMHGMTAYLNDALEVYGYEQENNAFFNTLKIRLPENCDQATFQQIAQDYELDYLPCDEDFILVSISAEDDNESLEAIIECLAEAGENFGVPVDEENWEDICALDGSLLR